jgi:hypothetical protein
MMRLHRMNATTSGSRIDAPGPNWVQPQFGTKAEISSGRTRFAALNLSSIHQRVTSIGQLLVNANRGEWEKNQFDSRFFSHSPCLPLTHSSLFAQTPNVQSHFAAAPDRTRAFDRPRAWVILAA